MENQDKSFYSAKWKKIGECRQRGKCLIIDLIAFCFSLHPIFHRCHRFFKVSTDFMSSFAVLGFNPMDIIGEEYVWNIDSYSNKFIRNNKIIKLLRSQWFLGQRTTHTGRQTQESPAPAWPAVCWPCRCSSWPWGPCWPWGPWPWAWLQWRACSL